ncbi:hypothetical protein H1R20_g1268, partial [Candolleomyces eurysporus]
MNRALNWKLKKLMGERLHIARLNSGYSGLWYTLHIVKFHLFSLSVDSTLMSYHVLNSATIPCSHIHGG